MRDPCTVHGERFCLRSAKNDYARFTPKITDRSQTVEVGGGFARGGTHVLGWVMLLHRNPTRQVAFAHRAE